MQQSLFALGSCSDPYLPWGHVQPFLVVAVSCQACPPPPPPNTLPSQHPPLPTHEAQCYSCAQTSLHSQRRCFVIMPAVPPVRQTSCVLTRGRSVMDEVSDTAVLEVSLQYPIHLCCSPAFTPANASCSRLQSTSIGISNLWLVFVFPWNLQLRTYCLPVWLTLPAVVISLRNRQLF